MFTIPFSQFPSDIYVDEMGRTVGGCPQHAKSVYAEGVSYVRIAKQKVVTGDNRCLEYYWSHWATLVGEGNGIRHYKLLNQDHVSGKIPLPAQLGEGRGDL